VDIGLAHLNVAEMPSALTMNARIRGRQSIWKQRLDFGVKGSAWPAGTRWPLGGFAEKGGRSACVAIEK
jgi:hypothetical protein